MDILFFAGICAVFYLIAAGCLSRLFGVDASRLTPAAENGRAWGFAALLLLWAFALSGLLIAAFIPLYATEDMRYHLPAMMASMGTLAACGGLIGYAGAFVAVRCGGEGLAGTAEQLFSRGAKRAAQLLVFAGCVLTSCVVLVMVIEVYCILSGDIQSPLDPLFVAAVRSAVLCSAALLPQQYLARRVKNERHLCGLSLGAALALAVLTASLYPSFFIAVPFDVKHEAAGHVLMISMLVLLHMLIASGADALCGLSERGLVKKKRLPFAAACLIVPAAAFVLLWIIGRWALAAAAAAGIAACLIVLLVCVRWFVFVGRGCAAAALFAAAALCGALHACVALGVLKIG